MKRLFSFLLIILPFILTAQQDTCSYIVVSDIIIEGNNVTLSSIILKELTFSQGDTISIDDWEKELRISKENIQNTTLFNFVDIECVNTDNSQNGISVNIKVTERWYLWAYPYLSYADRNLNAWYEADNLKRFSYGFDVEHKNFLGLKHTVRLIFISGYNQNYGFSYNIPYLINKFGLEVGAAYKRDKEVAYKSEYNKVLYFNGDNKFAKQSADAYITPYYRINHRNKIYLTISYNNTDYHDTLAYLNKDFCNSQDSRFQYLTLSTTYKNDYRDEQNYPLKGHYLEIFIQKIGLGITEDNPDVFYGKLTSDWYQPIKGRWYWASNLTLKMSSNYDAPYFLNQGLGYNNDYVRTYELYVIDAMNFALVKNNLKFAILNPITRYIPFIKNERFGKIHFALYANIFFDCAYSWKIPTNQTSYLNNKFIYGTGIGIDFVTYYDKVLRLEYGVNDMGEFGLFIHFVAPI